MPPDCLTIIFERRTSRRGGNGTANENNPHEFTRAKQYAMKSHSWMVLNQPQSSFNKV
jgi:hypothetical protein